jgi:hypothetical protein
MAASPWSQLLLDICNQRAGGRDSQEPSASSNRDRDGKGVVIHTAILKICYPILLWQNPDCPRRSQIAQSTDRTASHLAQLIAAHLSTPDAAPMEGN